MAQIPQEFEAALTAIPRLGIADLPTPLHPLKRLTAHLGGPQIWVKREDCTGLGFGGNKLRKLDYVLHEAIAAGADTLVSGGVVQGVLGFRLRCRFGQIDRVLFREEEGHAGHIRRRTGRNSVNLAKSQRDAADLITGCRCKNLEVPGTSAVSAPNQ